MDALKKRQQLEEFAKKLKEMSVEDLRKLEQEVIAEAETTDKKVSETEFDLPTENYAHVAEAIQKLLNKQTVEWRFTLGLVSMHDFWDPTNYPKKIKYPMLDATLRTLGEMQYTGYEEWAMVVAVNKYFESLHDKYVSTTEAVYDIASKHNAVLDELKLREPLDETIPDSIEVK